MEWVLLACVSVALSVVAGGLTARRRLALKENH
jgi:hypothetical protein